MSQNGDELLAQSGFILRRLQRPDVRFVRCHVTGTANENVALGHRNPGKPPIAAIFASVSVLKMQSWLARLHGGEQRKRAVHIVGMKEVGEDHASDFGGSPPKNSLPCGVRLDKNARLIDDGV